ncbi:hypothetical protein NC651_014693 [Populus alba x Populus x berolinensis]|nr:hypothetical protein NC651_014693 [Populus alba x Populus x berolinensis]
MAVFSGWHLIAQHSFSEVIKKVFPSVGTNCSQGSSRWEGAWIYHSLKAFYKLILQAGFFPIKHLMIFNEEELERLLMWEEP